MKKNTVYIFDSNVILSDLNAIYNFGSADIVIPFQVLEEIDKFKTRLDNVGFNARGFIKNLDELRKKGNLYVGVKIHKSKGLLYVKDLDVNFKSSFSLTIPDNKIIATAIIEKFNNPDKLVVVVSNDVNVRIKCDSYEVASQNYSDNIKIVDKREHLYSGWTTVLVDDQVIDRFYNGENITLEKNKLFPNQFVMLVSNLNEKKTAIARYVNPFVSLKRVQEYKKGVFGVTPKNKEQLFSLNLLMDPNVPVVSLTGTAGSGKTVLALAASLEQTLGKDAKYNRILISRPMIPMGKEIGFMPGSKEEKIMPWLAPISDNLQYLLGNDRNMLESYVDKGIIELEAISFIRGRTIANAIMLFDEVQSLTAHEVKTILTRVGEGTKIIFTGDIQQLDNIYVNEFTNGLTYCIEKLKGQDIFGCVALTKGERSKVATIAAEIL